MEQAVEAVRKQIEGDDTHFLMVISCLMRHPQFPELLMKAYRTWNAPRSGTDMESLEREAKELRITIQQVMDAISGHVQEHARQIAYTHSAVALLRAPAEGKPN